MLLQTCLAACALATLSYAQSATSTATTASADQPIIQVLAVGGGGDQDHLYVSIVASDATATTFALNCSFPETTSSSSADGPAETEGRICNFFQSQTITQGPSTFAAGYSFNDATLTARCNVTDSTLANCFQTMISAAGDGIPREVSLLESTTGSDGKVTEVLSTSLTGTDMEYFPATVTAGELNGSTGIPTDTSSTGGGATGTGSAGSTSAGVSGSASGSSGSGSSGASQVMLKGSGLTVGLVALAMVML